MVEAPASYPATLPAEAQAYARQFFEFARRGEEISSAAGSTFFKVQKPSNEMMSLFFSRGRTVSLTKEYIFVGDIESMRAPLEHGLPPNLTNDKGDTLIMLAAYHGHFELVEFLIQKGADPNRVNDRGQSPLAGAVFKNEARVVHALLAGGADPDVGQPSAMEAARIFSKLDEYGEAFERARASKVVG